MPDTGGRNVVICPAGCTAGRQGAAARPAGAALIDGMKSKIVLPVLGVALVALSELTAKGCEAIESGPFAAPGSPVTMSGPPPGPARMSTARCPRRRPGPRTPPGRAAPGAWCVSDEFWQQAGSPLHDSNHR